MAYNPQSWVDGAAGGTPLSAARLTTMEAGIEDADSRITAEAAARAAALAALAPVATSGSASDLTTGTIPEARIPSTIARDTEVAAAVAALVASAPGALDTLDELAAALGDDANYAASVTAALAGKAAKTANLSDLASIPTARSNLGIPFVHVRDFFAGGRVEGTTNDAPALTSAIAALPAEGGIIALGQEKIRLTTAVLINKTVTIVGAHQAQARITLTASNLLQAGADGVVLDSVHIAGSGAQYLQIFDTTRTTGAYTGWRFLHCKITAAVLALRAIGRPVVPGPTSATTGTGHASDVQIIDCDISAVESNYAVELAGLDGFVVANCNVHHNGISGTVGEGMKILGGSKNYRVVNNHFHNNTRDGVDAYDSYHGTFIGNVFNDNGVDGLEIKRAVTDGHTVDRMIVLGNKAHNNGNEGFHVSVPLSVILGNEAWLNGGNGIRLGAPVDDPTTGITAHTAITSNVAYQNGASGISLSDGATEVACSQNQANENTAFGITLGARTARCVLTGNVAYGNVGGRGISLLGIGHQLVSNRTQDPDGDARVDASATLTLRNGYGEENSLAIGAAPTLASWPVGARVRNTTDGALWQRQPAAWQVLVPGAAPPGASPMISGCYIVPPGMRQVQQIAASTEYAVPVWLGQSGSLDRIAMEVTVAGTAGTVIRLGVRQSTAAGRPGTLMLDAGTVDAAVVGTPELTIALSIPSPGWYWLTATAQSTGATLPTVRVTQNDRSNVVVSLLAQALGASLVSSYITAATTSGALPATYTINNRSGVPPLIVVRAA